RKELVMIPSRLGRMDVEIGEDLEEPREDVIRFAIELLELLAFENKIEGKAFVEGAGLVNGGVDHESVAMSRGEIAEEPARLLQLGRLEKCPDLFPCGGLYATAADGVEQFANKSGLLRVERPCRRPLFDVVDMDESGLDPVGDIVE